MLPMFTRVIFCASEKMIKRFVRARNKNKSIQGVPRNKNKGKTNAFGAKVPELTEHALK